MNCHGCKFLWKEKGPAGTGYCIHVTGSKSYQSFRLEGGKLLPSSCVRTADMERCELYAEGDYATRYQREDK